MGERTVLICRWALVFIGLWAVVQVLLLALACLPLASIVPSMKDRCLPVDPVWYLSSAMNIATDFVIFLIPMPSLINLRTKGKKQKALLLVVFGLGFLSVLSIRTPIVGLYKKNWLTTWVSSTCIISIIRIFSLSKRTQSKDIFWTSVATACWSIVELHCGIICSCLATLRPLLRFVFPHLMGVTRDNALSYELQGQHSVKNAVDGKSVINTRTGPPSSSSTEALRGGPVESPRQADRADQITYTGKHGANAGSRQL